MPVYEYECSDCSKKFEMYVPQRMSTEGVVCRQCHGPNVKKLISTFSRVGRDSEPAYATSQTTGGGCCGGAGGCACGH